MVSSHGMGRSGTTSFPSLPFPLFLCIAGLIFGGFFLKLFLRFEGPTTILVQSRTARLAEVFRKDDFSELADTEPGALSAFTEPAQDQKKKIVIGATDERQTATTSSRNPKALKVAIVKDGKLEFQDSDFKAFTRS